MREQSLRELLEEKVTLDIEEIDRLYLNAYQPLLQPGGGVSVLFQQNRRQVVASTTAVSHQRSWRPAESPISTIL